MPKETSTTIPRRIPELDGLRGIAILLVLLWHYLGVLAQVRHRSPLAAALATLRVAWSGVDLFFVLSGFLIGGILIDARRSPTYFATFYRRRFFRIVPLYSVLCVLFWIGVALTRAHEMGAGRELLANPLPWYSFVFFVQNAFMAHRGTFQPLAMGVTWSLAVEEQFYLTFPLLVRLLTPRRLLQAVVAIAAAAPVLRALAFYLMPHGDMAAKLLTPMRADALAAGVLSAMAVRSPAAREALTRHRGAIKAAVGVLAAGTLLLMLFNCTTSSSAVMSIGGYSWLAALYALVLLLAVSKPAGRLGLVFRLQWLRSLGEIAYGTYLMHVTVVGICFAVILGRPPRITSGVDLGVTLLAAGVTIVLARASWTLFEKKMIRLGQRYTYAEPPTEARESSTLAA